MSLDVGNGIVLSNFAGVIKYNSAGVAQWAVNSSSSGEYHDVYVNSNELVKQMPEQKDYFNSHFNELSERLKIVDEKFTSTVKAGRTKKIIVSLTL